MNNSLQVQGFNVLTELTHSDAGNPHSQYKGINSDTMIKPSFDLTLPASNKNSFWKIASFNLDKTSERNVTLCFDLFDEYNGLVINKSSYEINFYPTGEKSSSTQFYKNGVFKRIYGNEYDRIYIVENVTDTDITSYQVFIKNKLQWNFPKVSISYINVNEPSFVLHNNEKMIDILPTGSIFTNIPDKKSLISHKSTKETSFIKLADFDFNFSEARKTFIFTITKCRETSNSKPSYAKILVQFYNNGIDTNGWVSSNFYFIESLNFTREDLFLTKDSVKNKRYYLYGKFANIGEYYSISLEEHLDYSFSGSRELQIVNNTEVDNFEGVQIFAKTTDTIPIYDSVNKTYNNFYWENYVLKIKNSSNDIMGVLPKPRTVTDSSASDINTMKIDFNNLLKELRNTGVLK